MLETSVPSYLLVILFNSFIIMYSRHLWLHLHMQPYVERRKYPLMKLGNLKIVLEPQVNHKSSKSHSFSQ